MSLLLVEDDVSLREELYEFLGDFFEHIDVASDAESAYKSFLITSYDLVITDIQLPNQNGLKLVEKIKKNIPTQMVIVISAYKEVDYFLKSIELGIFSFLTKPFDSQQLINTMFKATSQLNHQRNLHDATKIILHHNVYFNVKEKTLYVQNEKVDLTNKEEILLALLVKNQNLFIRSEQIAIEVWKGDEVNSSTLRALIKRLRDKLDYEDSIINLKSRGYKLNTIH